MSDIIIRNETKYPDATVRRIIKFAARDLELRKHRDVFARVAHTRPGNWRRQSGSMYGASGYARNYWYEHEAVPPGTGWVTDLYVGRPGDFPVDWYDKHGMMAELQPLADWREALVCIAAHELRHVESYQLGRHRPGSKRGRRAEEERADAYAAARLRAWRRGGKP